MSDEYIGFALDLKVSDGISGLDEFSNGLRRTNDATADAASRIASSLDSATSSVDNLTSCHREDGSCSRSGTQIRSL